MPQLNQDEIDARRRADAAQRTQSRPGPGEVPTGGRLVEAEGYVGQQPYTDPPPMALRRFYEDPKPPGAATEQQVLQGRGAPAPYPPLEPPQREWNPRRFPDQMDVPRPADSAQPNEYEANTTMTLAQFLALPREQQDKILSQAREHPSLGQAPEYKPTRQYIEEEDRREQEAQRTREQAERERQAQYPLGPAQGAAGPAPVAASSGVPRMAPATQGTMTAAHEPEPDAKEPQRPQRGAEPPQRGAEPAKKT